jgi:hypothetical protein
MRMVESGDADRPRENGTSHDVIDNKLLKKSGVGASHDVVENKGLAFEAWEHPTIFMKTKDKEDSSLGC